MLRRTPLPEKIAGAPTLHSGLEVFYAAFLELSTCRQVGMAVGPIPWDAVDRYAEREGFDDEGYEDLLHFVRALDNAYLAHERAQAAKKDKKEA